MSNSIRGFFDVPDKLSRKDFQIGCSRFLVVLAISVVIEFGIRSMDNNREVTALTILFLVIRFVLFLSLIVMLLRLLKARAKDLGLSPYCVLLIFVPVVNLYFLFKLLTAET